jgi:hypothetical protein
MAVGCYPGSFNPPTIAHLAVADAARRQAGLDRIDLVLSVAALGKSPGDGPPVDRRRAVLEVVAEARLIADIAAGYDAVVLGADKWAQVLDPAWYDGSTAARDEALARLPRVLVAPRAGDHPADVELLDVPATLHQVNASAIRSGHPDATEWALPEALASGLWPPHPT